MYKVLEEVHGSSVELLVGAQVITRERVFILDAQESLEKMEPEVDRKEEALNEALKALIGEEIGERRLDKDPDFGQNGILEEVLEAGNEMVERTKASVLKNNEGFQSGKSTRITKSPELSLEGTRAELLVWWKESFALVKRGSLNAIWGEAEVKEKNEDGERKQWRRIRSSVPRMRNKCHAEAQQSGVWQRRFSW